MYYNILLYKLSNKDYGGYNDLKLNVIMYLILIY